MKYIQYNKNENMLYLNNITNNFNTIEKTIEDINICIEYLNKNKKIIINSDKHIIFENIIYDNEQKMIYYNINSKKNVIDINLFIETFFLSPLKYDYQYICEIAIVFYLMNINTDIYKKLQNIDSVISNNFSLYKSALSGFFKYIETEKNIDVYFKNISSSEIIWDKIFLERIKDEIYIPYKKYNTLWYFLIYFLNINPYINKNVNFSKFKNNIFLCSYIKKINNKVLTFLSTCEKKQYSEETVFKILSYFFYNNFFTNKNENYIKHLYNNFIDFIDSRDCFNCIDYMIKNKWKYNLIYIMPSENINFEDIKKISKEIGYQYNTFKFDKKYKIKMNEVYNQFPFLFELYKNTRKNNNITSFLVGISKNDNLRSLYRRITNSYYTEFPKWLLSFQHNSSLEIRKVMRAIGCKNITHFISISLHLPHHILNNIKNIKQKDYKYIYSLFIFLVSKLDVYINMNDCVLYDDNRNNDKLKLLYIFFEWFMKNKIYVLGNKQTLNSSVFDDIFDYMSSDIKLENIRKWNPNMSFKKTIEESKKWHRDIYLNKYATYYVFKNTPVNRQEVYDFIFTPLNTGKDIIEESEKMCHCVNSYIKKIKNGLCYIFHVSNKHNNEEGTLELKKCNDIWVLGQFKGIKNATMSTEAEKAVLQWYKTYIAT